LVRSIPSNIERVLPLASSLPRGEAGRTGPALAHQPGSVAHFRTGAFTTPFEKLLGDPAGAHSRRINIQHRLVYQVPEKERAVKVLRLWTHYE